MVKLSRRLSSQTTARNQKLKSNLNTSKCVTFKNYNINAVGGIDTIATALNHLRLPINCSIVLIANVMKTNIPNIYALLKLLL
jgi:hypothetical protein